MIEYYIFIDETGSFSYRNTKSFIGGWVCRKESLKCLERKLRGCVERFNYFLGKERKTQYLIYPHHLHFMPLHVRNTRKIKDQSISVTPHLVPKFFRDVFREIEENSLFIFRSTGKPFIIANEHSGYMDVLRNTLLQLIDEPLFTPDSRIHILIGHRRMEMTYGLEGFKNWKDYENYISKCLTKELRNAFVG